MPSSYRMQGNPSRMKTSQGLPCVHFSLRTCRYAKSTSKFIMLSDTLRFLAFSHKRRKAVLEIFISCLLLLERYFFVVYCLAHAVKTVWWFICAASRRAFLKQSEEYLLCYDFGHPSFFAILIVIATDLYTSYYTHIRTFMGIVANGFGIVSPRS